MKTKTIKILATPPNKEHCYVILPIGLYCNRELQNAKEGDELVFQDSWSREKRKFIRSCKVKVNSEVFTFLIKSLIRDWHDKDTVFKRWEAECQIQGIGKNAFSKEEVLLIEVEDII